MRLIDADDLSQLIESYGDEHPSGLIVGDILIQDVLDFIAESPTVYAASVVHAHWRPSFPNAEHWFRCSRCGRELIIHDNEVLADYPYCHCGARMDEEVQD